MSLNSVCALIEPCEIHLITLLKLRSLKGHLRVLSVSQC